MQFPQVEDVPHVFLCPDGLRAELFCWPIESAGMKMWRSVPTSAESNLGLASLQLSLRATDELDLELVRKGSDLNTPGKPAGVSQVSRVPFLPYQADTGFGGAKKQIHI